MIVLGGIKSEPNLVLLTQALRADNVNYVMLDQRQAGKYSIELNISDSGIAGHLDLANESLNLLNASAVYVRLMDDRILPELRNEPEDSAIRSRIRSFHDIFYQWMDVTPALVVNRTEPQGSNSSKPYQSQLIQHLGFRVPPTLITSAPAEVLAFRRQYGAIIFKSMSGARSIVKTLDDDDIERLHCIEHCPVQFQAKVEGTDVRVHVVETDVFATEIVSDATDYRYAKRDGKTATLQPRTLNADLRDKCIALTSGLGLTMSGIDLRIDRMGRAICFEVNPLPSFSYYQYATAQPVAGSLAKALRRASVA